MSGGGAGRAARAAFALACCASAGTLLGAHWRWLGLLGHFQGQAALAWLLALALFAAVPPLRRAFRRPRRAVAAAAVLLALHLAHLATLFAPPNPRDPLPGSPETLTVVWFNMQHRAKALLQLERSWGPEPPEVLALGETNGDTAPSAEFGFGHAFHDETARNGIWSRWPIESPRAHAVPGDRDLLEAVIVKNGRRLPILVAHWRLPIRPSHPVAAHAAAGVARAKPHLLLLGDLNTTPWSDSMRVLERDAGLRRLRLPPGRFGTWSLDRWHFFSLPIDFALVKGDVRALELRLLPWTDSDHRPFRARLAFTGE